MSCFVPNCKSTEGLPFPCESEIIKKRCLDDLGFEISPDVNSFACYEHLNALGLNVCDDSDGPSTTIKKRVTANLNDFEDLCESTICERKICRLCNTSKDLYQSIYNKFDKESDIASIITLCCYPLTIERSDPLPKYICKCCLKQLRASNTFRIKCIEIDEMWRNNLGTLNKNVQEISKGKTKEVHVNTSPEGKLHNSEDEPVFLQLEEMENNFHNENDSETYEYKAKKPRTDWRINIKNSLPQISVKKGLQDSITSKSVKYDDIEKHMEEIHGIKEIRVVASASELDNKGQNNKQRNVLKQKPTIKTMNNVIKIDYGSKSDIFNLPKGITLRHQQLYKSQTGHFPYTVGFGLQEHVFVLTDRYLFSFGLSKSSTRYLHCIIPNCHSTGEQKLLPDGNCEDTIFVKTPHNHEPSSEKLRKKDMFFYIMRKRMQHDRTLNIRNIYEEVCVQEPEIRQLVPLRNVINEICRQQVSTKMPQISSFEEFYDKIEEAIFQKLHYTSTNKQFYQEKFSAEDGSLAVIFCNPDIIEEVSSSKLMYVDASFKIDTTEDFKYQLVTVLVWIDDSYYPIMYSLVNMKTQEIFKKVFKHLHDHLAPNLRPHEIVTDYEANLYYALGETYLESHIGGSVFYYTQNLYKKICSLNLSKDLEKNSNFRNTYHMLLMLPLLPVNTILDGLNNIEIQAKDIGLTDLIQPIFNHIRSQWIFNVTPELFCVHRLENRINENVIAPFKKLRDFLLLFKGKSQITIIQVVEKLIELESFLHSVYTKLDKKSFGRDLSSFQKKNVVRAWQFIELHPKINVNSFFQKVLGYIKCMENQLWIWGFYRYSGEGDDILINASNFSAPTNEDVEEDGIVPLTEELIRDGKTSVEVIINNTETLEGVDLNDDESSETTIVMEAVIDNDGGIVLQSNDEGDAQHFEKTFLKYVQYE